MDFAKSGIAATGTSLAAAGFTLVQKKCTTLDAAEMNTVSFLAASSLEDWLNYVPDPTIRGVWADATTTSPQEYVNTDPTHIYKRQHSELHFNLGSSDTLYIKDPTPAAGSNYSEDAIVKGNFYMINDEIVGSGGSTITDNTGYMSSNVAKRACFGTTETLHTAGDEVFQVVFGFPDIEYWGAVQAHSDHTAIGKLEGDKNIASYDESQSINELVLLRGDIIQGRFTHVAIDTANGENQNGGGLLLYIK